jgi:hypothetical protein
VTDYNVVVSINGKSVEKADLYWVDADLQFIDDSDKPNNDIYTGLKETSNDGVITSEKHDPSITTSDAAFAPVEGLNPTSGSTWQYGVLPVSNRIHRVGKLANKTMVLTGLKVNVENKSKIGSIEALSNGTVKATSTKSGVMKVMNYLNNSSVGSDMTFTAGGTPVTYAGKGTTTIEKDLTVDVTWDKEVPTAGFVSYAPMSVKGSNERIVYLHVTDKFGNAYYKDSEGNPVKATFMVKGSGKLQYETAADVWADAPVGGAEVTLSEYGYARVKVLRDGDGTADITATVDGISGETFVETLKWADLKTGEKFAIDAAGLAAGDLAFDAEKGTITIPMNKEMYTGSASRPTLINELFTVTCTDTNGTQEWTVKGVETDGTNLIIKVAPVTGSFDNNSTIAVVYSDHQLPAKSNDDVVYGLYSVDGIKLQNGAHVEFVVKNNTAADISSFTS